MGHFALVALLAALATSVLAEPVPQPWKPIQTAAPIERRQEAPDDCTFFEAPASPQEDCAYFAARWGISVQDFINWNPSVGADCTGIVIGQEYCVERNWGIPEETTTTTTTTTTTIPFTRTTTVPTGSHRPSPTQPGLIESCTAFYMAVSGDTCDSIVARYGTFTLVQFRTWNPAVGSECRSLWAETYYCVGIPGTPTSRPSTTTRTTATTTGVIRPSPTQSGLIESCVAFYMAVSGDTCDSIVARYGTFTLVQFRTWNPAVGSECRSLWAETYYCLGIPGTPTTSIRPTTTSTRPTSTTTRGNGIATPSPTQPNIVNNCNRFYLVQPDETCQQIAARNGITLQRFNTWNPSVGSSCSGLWANTYACVSIIGYVPPLTTACGSAGKTWGDNQPSALNNAVSWCDGNAGTDGSGAYAIGQTKTGCYNAPYGVNRVQLTARNDWGIRTSLSVANCERIIRAAINNGVRGGTGTFESWYFTYVDNPILSPSSMIE
ncbi:hypothetical protein S7711_09857 [Stachybotrys chartarum IBT 7711]|uniref:LysM domain-containing protein n=1 Tax=Stachybotrys chartarum (strain CBS 109288 / IBT 7711) TaxID=1280523 RepID=A0A084AID5_STACB|nr:hypothetical protein S7711_09857 [Stachybotrys chartarum IBT 7711]